jgi:hypothetical protein
MDTVETNVKELASNRWTNMFGLDEVSKHSFVEYLGKRLWQVRGELIDTAHSDRRLASDKYVKSMISESKYWETKDEIKCVYDAVVDNARVADDYAYKPLNEQILSDVNCEQVMFNTYKAPDTSETVPTDAELALWSRYWEHLLKDETERNRVQQWVASLAFQPEKRTGIAVLLHGLSTGTGKGTLGDIITALVGSSNAAKPMNAVQSLTGRFNAALEGKVLFIIDELYEGGNFKLANGIKGKITEPSLEVEPKNKELRKIDNYCNFFATSNHLTPLWLDDKDRRWEVYAVEYDEGAKEQHQKDVRAFRQWFDSCQVHAISVIRSILKTVDISNYKPWVEGAMATEAKRKLINNSVSSKQNDFELHWNHNQFDNDMVVNASSLFVDEWRKVTAGQRTEILTNLGCQKLESNGSVKIGNTQSRAWWITPKGLTVGMSIYMNGKEIGGILAEHRSDVTGTSYDDASETLTVSTRTQF